MITWKQFKKKVKAAGVEDDWEIEFIDYPKGFGHNDEFEVKVDKEKKTFWVV